MLTDLSKQKIISASILSANFAKLGEEVNSVLDAGVNWIHFDVMDNHFVPNLTFGPLVCKSLRDFGITAPIDVHLMVQSVDQLIIEFAKSGANLITIHPESTLHLNRSLQLIKDYGCKAGIALSPATPIDVINYIYDQIDLILIMSVNPGFAGQKFISSSLKKIENITKLLNQLNCQIALSIDGGINLNNIAELSRAGINIFVAGSSIFKENEENLDNHKNIITKMRSLI